MDGSDIANTCGWLQKSNLKSCTEALICNAQEQALQTNYIKFRYDKTIDSPLCKMCGNKNKTVLHIVSECSMLAQREYKKRHENVARYLHWRLCEKYKLDRTNKWYDHKPEGVVENVDYKILWHAMSQCKKKIEARKPHIVLVDKKIKRLKSLMLQHLVMLEYVRKSMKRLIMSFLAGQKPTNWLHMARY